MTDSTITRLAAGGEADPSPIVGFVFWMRGRAVPSPSADARVRAWQDAAMPLVTPEHPLVVLRRDELDD